MSCSRRCTARKALFGQIRRHLDTVSCAIFLGHKFWARGYFVSTVGRDKETIRTYIKNQEIADKAVESVASEARVLIKSHLLYQNPS